MRDKILKQIANGEIPEGYKLHYSSEFEKELQEMKLAIYDECLSCGNESRLNKDGLCVECWKRNKEFSK